MGEFRRLRGLRYGKGFEGTVKRRGYVPGSSRAQQLSATIRSLRVATLPATVDLEVDLPPVGNAWARGIPETTDELVFSFDETYLLLIVVRGRFE